MEMIIWHRQISTLALTVQNFPCLLSSAVSFLLQGQTLAFPVTIIYKLPVADTTTRHKAEAMPCLAFEWLQQRKWCLNAASINVTNMTAIFRLEYGNKIFFKDLLILVWILEGYMNTLMYFGGAITKMLSHLQKKDQNFHSVFP